MAKKLGIILLDDKQMVQEGLKLLIEREPELEVVDTAIDDESALYQIKNLKPDVVIIDLLIPGMDAAEVTKTIVAALPETKVLTMSSLDEPEPVRRVLEAGAKGFIRKRAASAELIKAIKEVAEGNLYLDPAMTDGLVTQFLSNKVARGERTQLPLSPRETEVLRLIAQGYSNKEIAARLNISAKSVETYKSRSMEKTGLQGRVEIVRYALQRGWLHAK